MITHTNLEIVFLIYRHYDSVFFRTEIATVIPIVSHRIRLKLKAAFFTHPVQKSKSLHCHTRTIREKHACLWCPSAPKIIYLYKFVSVEGMKVRLCPCVFFSRPRSFFSIENQKCHFVTFADSSLTQFTNIPYIIRLLC